MQQFRMELFLHNVRLELFVWRKHGHVEARPDINVSDSSI